MGQRDSNNNNGAVTNGPRVLTKPGAVSYKPVGVQPNPYGSGAGINYIAPPGSNSTSAVGNQVTSLVDLLNGRPSSSNQPANLAPVSQVSTPISSIRLGNMSQAGIGQQKASKNPQSTSRTFKF
jgi:hypothetical protein